MATPRSEGCERDMNLIASRLLHPSPEGGGWPPKAAGWGLPHTLAHIRNRIVVARINEATSGGSHPRISLRSCGLRSAASFKYGPPPGLASLGHPPPSGEG